MASYQFPDSSGHFGRYGGSFASETLTFALKELREAYARYRYRICFIGMATIENRRIIVAVMIDEPSAGQYFGGLVAAPVFSEVVQQTLRMMGVQPDMAVKPQIVADTVEESF